MKIIEKGICVLSREEQDLILGGCLGVDLCGVNACALDLCLLLACGANACGLNLGGGCTVNASPLHGGGVVSTSSDPLLLISNDTIPLVPMEK
ncbi:MAG: hypothetical protein LBI82_07265 [Dysgonamonadaceae bacterium]|jgi:hypothetical protein|nr:hypothetical protein [Dysgonamonadaceae bacterium]